MGGGERVAFFGVVPKVVAQSSFPRMLWSNFLVRM